MCAAGWYKRSASCQSALSIFGPANRICPRLGLLQVALDQSNKDAAVMQGWLAVSSLTWAARYHTWLLIKLTPKGVVFSSISFLSM